MKLRSPIPKKYWAKRKVCVTTQLFGENKNRLFYGPRGHLGIDFRTKHGVMYKFHNKLGYVAKKMGINYRLGEIDILASHDGYVVSKYNDDKTNGIYVWVRSDPFTEGEETVQLQTTYFHLSRCTRWKGDPYGMGYKKKYGPDFIKAGARVGKGGNTGKYSTAPHLHLTLRRRVKNGPKWGRWEKVDPMPYLTDGTVYRTRNHQYYKKGRQLTNNEQRYETS